MESHCAGRIDKGHQHRTQVVADAREVLSQSPLFRGRMNLINVEEQDGNLVLEGRLPSFYLKQMLQTLLRDIKGVVQIDNRVNVDWPTTRIENS